jgi:hypothetical protein
MNIKRIVLVKGNAALTLVAWLHIRTQMLTVYGFGKNPGTGCFAHTPRPRKKEGLRQMIVFNRVF